MGTAEMLFNTSLTTYTCRLSRLTEAGSSLGINTALTLRLLFSQLIKVKK